MLIAAVIPNLSDSAIEELHRALRKAFDHDEASGAGKKTYGVREYSDWKQESDLLEAELSKRNIPYEPIPW